jgi:hypothetical protein
VQALFIIKADLNCKATYGKDKKEINVIRGASIEYNRK